MIPSTVLIQRQLANSSVATIEIPAYDTRESDAKVKVNGTIILN
jgi:hypothetical protein